MYTVINGDAVTINNNEMRFNFRYHLLFWLFCYKKYLLMNEYLNTSARILTLNGKYNVSHWNC